MKVTMPVVVITKPFHVEIQEQPVPEIAEDDHILVRTEYTGVSLGTEKVFYNGTWEPDPANYPINPGYESVGIVEQCGKKVTRYKPGDRVVSFGNHAGYVLLQEGGAEPVPNHIKPEKATLAILGATATHGIERGQIPYNGKVAIFGAGVMGLLLLQHAKLGGAMFVMVCDVVDEKLKIARQLGADLTINPKNQSPAEALKSAAGELADVCYEVAGGAAKAQEGAVRCAREHGRVLLMGGGENMIVKFPYRVFFGSELTILASRATGGPANFKRSLARIVNRQIQVDPIPTEIVPYTEIERIYKTLVEGQYGFIHLVLKW